MWREDIKQNLPITIETHRGEHVGNSTGDNEVEEPLGSSSKSNVHGSETSGGNLGDVNPAGRTPAELEEGGEEEDDDNGDVSLRRHGLALLGRINTHVETNVEHAETLSDGRPEKRATTTERVGSEEQESDTGEDLDDTVGTSSEERGAGTAHTEVDEDGRGIRVHGVGTGHLLADHEADGDESTVSVALDGPHLLLEVHEGGLAHELALVLKLLLDLAKLVLDIGVVLGQVAELGENGAALLPAVLASEPTGRLGAEEHADDEQDSGDTLNGERDDVLGRILEVLVGAVVDPEGNHHAGDDEELVQTGEETTNGTGRILRDVEGVDRRGGTDTETGEEATDEDGGKVGGRGGLEDDSEDDGQTGGEEGGLAAPFIGDGGGGQGTGEAAGLEGRDDVSCEIGSADGVGVI